MNNIFAAARLWRRPPLLLSMSTLMVLAACTPLVHRHLLVPAAWSTQ